MKKNFALIFGAGLAAAAIAQQIPRPTEFAGIPVSVSVSELMATGFSCVSVTGTPNAVKCVNVTSQGSVFGVPFSKREVMFISGNVVFVSAYTQPTSAPGQVVQTLTSTFDASYKRVPHPRFLEMSDNQSRIFWRAGALHTLSVQTAAMQDESGRPVVRFSMFMPSAH